MQTEISGFFPRVSYKFARLLDAMLVTFVNNVLTLVALLSSQYPTPSPSLATITTALETFQDAIQEAMNGGKIEIGARNAARTQLLLLMRQLGAYVQCHCGNSVQNIIATGFDAVRAPGPSGVLPPPSYARLEYTSLSGELLLKFARVPNAANYSIQSAESADGPWNDEGLSTTTRVTIDGLTPGKVYWARACANGAKGSSDWSGPATARAI